MKHLVKIYLGTKLKYIIIVYLVHNITKLALMYLQKYVSQPSSRV